MKWIFVKTWIFYSFSSLSGIIRRGKCIDKSGFSVQKKKNFTGVNQFRHDFWTFHSIETNHVLVDVELIVLQVLTISNACLLPSENGNLRNSARFLWATRYICIHTIYISRMFRQIMFVTFPSSIGTQVNGKNQVPLNSSNLFRLLRIKCRVAIRCILVHILYCINNCTVITWFYSYNNFPDKQF